MTMNLRVLLDDPTVPDVEIADLTLDSRALKPGDAFLALPGALQDGRRFVPEAFAQGAVAVLCEAGVVACQQTIASLCCQPFVQSWVGWRIGSTSRRRVL